MLDTVESRRPARRRSRSLAHSVITLVIVSLAFGITDAQATVKLVSWNVLNYPGSTGAVRNDDFQAVIGALDCDLLMLQEIQGLSGALTFRNNVLEIVQPGQWTLAAFTDGSDSDNALYIRSNRFTVADFGALPTTPRQIDWWQLRPAGNVTDGADIVLYSAHLKAGQTASDAEERRIAARATRDHMIATWPAERPVMVMGDFNLYTSTEGAYGALTGNPIEDAQLFDPISTPGSWNNNVTFANVHTQSTRTTQFGGGATGGMDSRFDFILVDADLQDTEAWDFVPGSYEAFGQDGNHFNAAVNAPPTNAAVGQALADNLHESSDHIPVVLELQEPARAQLIPESLAVGFLLEGASVNELVQLRNAVLPGADELDYSAAGAGILSVGGSTSGELAPGAVAGIQVGIDTSTFGLITDVVTITTDDPLSPSLEVEVSGRIVRPSRPSWDVATDVFATTEAETTAVDTDAEVVLTVYNVSDDDDQANVYVTGASLSGPDAVRFSLVDAPAFFVGAAPVERRIAVDVDGLGGVADGTVLEATVTFTTQDDFTVSGAQPRNSLIATIEVLVGAGAVPAPPTRLVTRLHPPVPTPFNPRTTISFDLERGGFASVEVMDMRGRRVRTLLDQVMSAGRHSVVWDGQDDGGRGLASGVYLIRLKSGDVAQVRRAVLVR